MSLKDIRAGRSGAFGLGDEAMCELITVLFGDRPVITRREFLESAERNMLLAMDQPDMRRAALKLAEQRLRQAMAAKVQQGGAG